MLGKCTRDLASILRYLWPNGDMLRFFFLMTQLECEGALINALPLCASINCHCSYCFNLKKPIFWLLVGSTLFKKKKWILMSSISVNVIRCLRNSDFSWLLCQTIELISVILWDNFFCVWLRFWSCLVFIYGGNYDNMSNAT